MRVVSPYISQSQSFECSLYYEHLWINACHRIVDIQKGLFGVNCVGSKPHSINFQHRMLIFCSYSYIKVYHVPNYQYDAICRTKKQRTGSSITTSSSTSNSNENHTTIYVYSKKKKLQQNPKQRKKQNTGEPPPISHIFHMHWWPNCKKRHPAPYAFDTMRKGRQSSKFPADYHLGVHGKLCGGLQTISVNDFVHHQAWIESISSGFFYYSPISIIYSEVGWGRYSSPGIRHECRACGPSLLAWVVLYWITAQREGAIHRLLHPEFLKDGTKMCKILRYTNVSQLDRQSRKQTDRFNHAVKTIWEPLERVLYQ